DPTPMGAPTAAASDAADTSALAETELGPGPDFALAPQLTAPEVTMRLDVPGTGMALTTGVGDLDGDGYGDFAAQGREYINGTQYVHIRYGGPRAASPEEQFVLEQSGARLIVGPFTEAMIAAIVPAGDVDGDGFDDLLVGLGRCDAAQTGEGAYLLYGGPERLSGARRFDEVGVLLRSPREPDTSGEYSSCYVEMDPWVAGLGDFDGDGFDDFVLSEPQPGDTVEPASLYLFYGSAQRLSKGASWLEADAVLQAPGNTIPTAIGDVNADGTADLLLSTLVGDLASIFIPGRSERWQGEIDAASSGTNIGHLLPFTVTGTGIPDPAFNPILLSPPDVDGDGVADLMFWGDENVLLYGRPGLFEGGVDLAEGIVLQNDADRLSELWFAGDRDGDGDADLVTRFYDDTFQFSDVAFSGGSRTRASGNLSFPVQTVLTANPEGYLHEQFRRLERMTLAGDLDGDGADDLLTTSSMYTPINDTDDPLDDEGFWVDAPELHIHYGVLGTSSTPLR
ncbi:MAG TPA: hypothetical protein VJU61_10600, partial [Polyangiaceae bacterium]|nr:hypothetical protein [Polyangiaceae bacterium]